MYEKVTPGRDEAIVQAFTSGFYSSQELGDYFGLHFTRIGKVKLKAGPCPCLCINIVKHKKNLADGCNFRGRND